MKSSFSILFLIFLGGCSTTSINKAEMAKVKRVAVVAFTMDYYLDLKSGVMGTLMGKEKKMGMSKIENKLVEKPISRKSYDVLIKKLNGLGWEVVGYQKAIRSPTLQAYYRKPVKTGFLPLQSRNERLEKKGVPQFHNVYSLKGSGQFSRIAKELNVDALIFVYVDTKMGNSFSLGPIGLGTYEYNAKIKFEVINPRTEEKILGLIVDGDGVEEKKKAQWFKDDLHQDNSFAGVQVAVDQLTNKIKEKAL